MIHNLVLGALLLGAAPAGGHVSDGDEVQRNWTVYAERVYTSTGEVIEDGAVKVADGKIVGITPGIKAPDGDDVLKAAAMTAGMIDASLRIATLWSVEQSQEVQPGRSVVEAIDVFDPLWKRQLKSGVTTALVNPVDSNVIGGQGAVVKTGGEETITARLVKKDAVVRGAIGTQPSRGNRPAFGPPQDFTNRRPTTRMGVEWEWRKALYDAAAGAQHPDRDFPGADVLREVLSGKKPLCIQAWATQDIRTAVFLKEEMQEQGFGEIHLILDAAAEAWREPQFLVRTGSSVILPPFAHDGRTNDGAFMSWNVAKMLQDAGVPVALSSHGLRSVPDRLGMQAGYAMRGGLTLEEALAAVTSTPAKMLGVESRVGSIEAGKDADLVLWSGTPFEPSSRVVGVLLEGELAVDPRP